jgi:SpoVK/Ycf46/Vps4 family AAA+-type ATPase
MNMRWNALLALHSLAAAGGASTSTAAMYLVGLLYACVHAFNLLPTHLRRWLCGVWMGACYDRVITASASSPEDRGDCNMRLVHALSEFFTASDPGWSERCTQGTVIMSRPSKNSPGAFGIKDLPEHWTALNVRVDGQRQTVQVSVAVDQDTITMRLRVRSARGGAVIARLCGAAEQAYERKLRTRHQRHLYIPQASTYCNSMGVRELLVQRVPLSRRMPLEGLCHPEAARIQRTLRSFANRSDVRAALPDKLGVFAYGVPGSGKTTLARAIADELDRDIILVDLNVVRNPTELGYLFGNGVFRVANATDHAVEYVTIEYDKVVILLDDVDCSADGVSVGNPLPDPPGKNTYEQPRLSLKNVLHEMDGIKETPGRVIVATANTVEDIDGAMRRRGRFDIILKFDYATVEMAMRKIRFIFGAQVLADLDERIREAVEAWLTRDRRRTLADVESICKEVLDDVSHLASAFDRDVDAVP